MPSLGITDKVHLAEQFTPLIEDLMSNPGFQRFWQAKHSDYSPAMKDWMIGNCGPVEGA